MREREHRRRREIIGLPLSSRYTFGNFVVGDGNREASSAALEVARQPVFGYNPLVFYGGVGMGKTHLLEAIGNYVCDQGGQVFYVNAAQPEALMDLIHQRRSAHKSIRQARVVLIDEAQLFPKDRVIRQGLRTLVNNLNERLVQLVFAADRGSQFTVSLENPSGDRLRESGGLVVRIRPPDLSTRITILEKKADEKQMKIAPSLPEVFDYLARRFTGSIRELERGLEQVVVYAATHNELLTLETAVAAVEEFFQRSRLTAESILAAVAEKYGISREAMTTHGRGDPQILQARHVAMYLLSIDTELSLAEIGELLGGFEYSTVINACARIRDELDANSTLSRWIGDIRGTHGVKLDKSLSA